MLDSQNRLAAMMLGGLTWRVPFSEALPASTAGSPSGVVSGSARQGDINSATAAAEASSSALTSGELFSLQVASDQFVADVFEGPLRAETSILPDFRRPRTAATTMNDAPPLYTSLLESSVSIAQLWEEWTKGRCGRPSVREMNRRHGRQKWVEPSHKKFYRRREAIVEAIEKCPSFEHASATAAIADRKSASREIFTSVRSGVSESEASSEGRDKSVEVSHSLYSSVS